jgi:Putative beta-barrel porin-2, OmpL-like. bbp2
MDEFLKWWMVIGFMETQEQNRMATASHVHELHVPVHPHRVRSVVTITMMWALLFGLLVWLLDVSPAHAQEKEAPPAETPAQPAADPSEEFWKNLRFGLNFEGYYEYNWNRPDDRVNALRAYDTRANTLGIQQTNLIFELPTDVDKGRRFGARLDLQYGQATETVQGSPANEPRPDVYRPVWQAFGTYVLPVGRGLQVDFGKWASNLGFETNYAKDDQAFSRAYLFNFLPFYHSGARVTLPVSDKVSVMYMLVNGIQQTEEFNNFKSNQFATVLKPLPQVTWTVNYYFGQEQSDNDQPDGPNGFFRAFDTYAVYAPTDRASFGLNVNYVTNEFEKSDPSISLQGTGVYARYQFTPQFAGGVRWERLDDEGLFGGVDQVLQEITGTAEWKVADGFLVRAEFRRDWSNIPFFPERGGSTIDHQNTALIGVVWWFGNKTGAW